MSTFDIFCFLATGATLCLATDNLLLFPESLVRFMEQESVTLWKGISSLLMYMCRAGVVEPDRLQALRTVIFAGEPLDPQYLAKWMVTFPKISFFNGYGPTEATGVSLCYHVDQIPNPGQPIPIGRPCKGAQVVVLGDNGFPVGLNEIGELCISGPCLAKGYLNDIEKTNKYFTTPPPGYNYLGDRVYHTGDLVRQTDDGNYMFISRKDYQVKWMGYRIELSEIESNLMAHPQVRGAVVLLTRANNYGLTELVAFFEADGEIKSSEIRQFLEQRIPLYMVPKRFVHMISFPRNNRGKIARDKILEWYMKFAPKKHAEIL
jgi:non-ribosomal peptide synthetase component F